MKPGNQLFERPFAFIQTNNIDAILQIKVRPFGRVRSAAKHEFDAVVLGNPRQTKHIIARDDVGVDPDNLRTDSPDGLFEILRVAERRVEYLHGKSGSLQIGGEIQNSQRRIRFHHAPFNDVVFQEISVGQ